jgi:hypothetical protein
MIGYLANDDSTTRRMLEEILAMEERRTRGGLGQSFKEIGS